MSDPPALVADLVADEGFSGRARRAMLECFRDDGLQKVEATLGLEAQSPDLRDEFAHLLWKYVLENRAPPRGNAPSDAPARIAKLSRELRIAITDSDFPSVGRFEAQHVVELLEHVEQWANLFAGARQKGRPVDLSRHAAIARLRMIEKHFTGKNSTYTFSDISEEFSGTLFTLFRVFENAAAVALDRPALADASLAAFLRRAKPSDKTDLAD